MNNLQIEEYKVIAEALDFRINELNVQKHKKIERLKKEVKRFENGKTTEESLEDVSTDCQFFDVYVTEETEKINNLLLKVTLPLLEPENAQKMYEIVKEVCITEILSMN